jgi:hypothetical protein
MADETATHTEAAGAETIKSHDSSASMPVLRPRRVAIWFEGEQPFDLLPFIFFVSSANAAQESFQFLFPDPPYELTYEVAKSRMEKAEPIFKQGYDVYVFITAAPIPGNLFFLEYGPLVQITTSGWQENFSPPSLFEYLFHSIMCGTLYALCGIQNHDDFTMGCQFEYTRVKELDRVDIALGLICRDHLDQLRASLGMWKASSNLLGWASPMNMALSLTR